MSRIVAGLSLLALTTLTGAALSVAGCSDGGTGTTGTGGGSATTSTTSTGGEGGAGGATSSATSSSTGGAAAMDVMIPFEGRVGAKVFACKDTYPGLGTAATEVAISDFRLYIHDVKLHLKGGADVPVELKQDGLWQYKNVAL